MYTRRLILILFFASVAAYSIAQLPAVNPGDQSIVTTDRGPVRGVVNTTLRMYLGIPYAAPPVGELRWRPPKVHERWSTPLNATKPGNHCPQEASVFGAASVTEDCLYLNVFTPNVSDEPNTSRKYPVMVWIHGGGLVLGESDDYDPAKLVEQGDVIVVAINYRLGALGFLAHRALSAESADRASGNYGIMDQQFALAWVQRNIVAFGGDPQNVTIFGQSAGGLSVLSHMTSPLAAGLFQRAIVQSGAYSLTLPALADAESQGSAFAASVGCSDQTAECLRSVPVETILANQDATFGFPTNPNVDGKVLPQSLDTAFATGQFQRVPLMQGTNHDEMRLFVALDELAAGHPLTRAEYRAQVLNMFGRQAGARVLAQYPVSKFTSPSLALGALETDSILACPARAVDQAVSDLVPTFAYEFNDTNAPEILLPPVSFPYGAAHGSELQYLFKLPQSLPLSGEQQELSNKMVGYWTQFARSGDPNSNSTPSWPLYNQAGEDFQSLVPPLPSVESEFASDHKCDFWDKLLGTNGQVAARVAK